MSYDEFQDPPQPGRFAPADWLGHLLLCEPQRYLESVLTQNGPSDAIEGTITVLSAPGGPKEIIGARVFQGQLIASLREAIGGKPVLGRLGQGQAQPGRSPAWILTPTSPEDKQFAGNYLATRQQHLFSEPSHNAGQAPPPNSQPQGYGQPSEQDRQWAVQQQYAPQTGGPVPNVLLPQPQQPAPAPVAPPPPVPAPAPAPSPQPAAQQQSAPVLELTAEQLENMPEETKKLLLGAAYKPPSQA